MMLQRKTDNSLLSIGMTALLLAFSLDSSFSSEAFVTPSLSSLSSSLTPQRRQAATKNIMQIRMAEGEVPSEDTAASDNEDMPIYFNILTEPNPPPSTTTTTGVDENTPTSSDLSPAALAASAAISSNYETASSNTNNNYPTLNGWTPKEDYALWGLPGAIPPFGFFDPIGFAQEGTTLNDAKRLREAETQHGRVAMLATVGYWSQEAMNVVGQGGPFHMTGPANDQLQQMPPIPFAILSIAIMSAELYRATRGWVEPKPRIGSQTLWTLRDSYYPGDLGFDPLGLKPTDNYDFQTMQTKELSHGRLAMIGWAGMCAQELVNHKTIGETMDFYSKIFSGEYYYSPY